MPEIIDSDNVGSILSSEFPREIIGLIGNLVCESGTNSCFQTT